MLVLDRLFLSRQIMTRFLSIWLVNLLWVKNILARDYIDPESVTPASDHLYDDAYYDDLYDEFKDDDWEHEHDHKFEEQDDHGHDADNLERISKKKFSEMNEQEKVFYRFKQADYDDDDLLDGLEIFQQISKMRWEHYEETAKRLNKLVYKMEQTGPDGKATNRKQIDQEQLEKNRKTLERMREDLEEDKVAKFSDQSMKALDKNDDGYVNFAEYQSVISDGTRNPHEN